MLNKYKESRHQSSVAIHCLFCFCAAEGHRLSLSYSNKKSESNDILIHIVEFSNVHNTDRTFHMKMYKYHSENNGDS